MLSRSKLYKISLFIGDAVILYGALFLTLTIRYGALPDARTWSVHKLPFFIIFAVWALIFYIAGLYDLEKFISAKEMQKRVAGTVVFAGLVAIMLFYFIPYFGITPKTNLFLDLALTLAFLLVWRKIFFNELLKAKKTRVAFFGTSDDIVNFAAYLKRNPQLGLEPAAIITLSEEGTSMGAEGVQTIKFDQDISRLIKDNGIALIITAPGLTQRRELIRMFYEILPLGVSIMDFARFYETITGKVPVSLINESWFLENLVELNKGPFESAKRWFDIVLAIALGLPTLAITPFLAAVIKLESPGPVFYSQKRVGKNGRLFNIVKFRSMRQDAESGGAKWATENDSRITRVGNILRKTRLDELPQLWNVLRGELSFIGPRPERPEFVETLKKEIPHYAMRHLIKPGLSGWAQINFPYGASVKDAMEKLQYDLFYIKNRSLSLDLIIFLKTLATVIRQQGR